MAPSHPFATAPSSGAGMSKFDSLFEESSSMMGPRSRAATMSPPLSLGPKPSVPNFGERSSSAGSFTSSETLAFEELFNQTEGLSQGYLTGDQAVPLFQRSGLDSATLSQIWQLADSKGEGLLRLPNFKVAMKLISLAQVRKPVSLAYLHEACPLPLFDGVRLSFGSASRRTDDIRNVRQSSLPRASPFDAKPASPFDSPVVARTINLSDAQKYYRIFLKASFNQDLLDGNAVRDIMVKTGLHINTLRNIWNIADTQGRGCLEAFEFIVAMFYVENILNETMAEVPALLPPKIKDSAISAVASLTSSPISRQSTFSKSGSTLNLGTPAKEDWAIPAADILKYGSFFDAIVPLPTGLMSSEEAYKFFIRSKLPSSTLSGIWELSSILNQDGLTRDEFAVAMHLIYATMGGNPLPRQLPRDLIPPGLRQPDPFLQGGGPQPFDPFLTKELPVNASPLPQDLLTFDSQPAPFPIKDDGCKEEILALNSQLKPLINDINAARIKKAQLLGRNQTMQLQEAKLQAKHTQEQALHTELTRELSELELLHKELLPIHSSTQEKHSEHQERFRTAQAKYAIVEAEIQSQLAKSHEAKQYVQASQATINHLTSQLKTMQVQPADEAADPFTALIERNPSPMDNPKLRAATDPFSDFPTEKSLTTLSFDELVAARSAPLERVDSASSHVSCHSRMESKPPHSGGSFPPKPESPISERSGLASGFKSTDHDLPIPKSAEPEFDPFTALISESNNVIEPSAAVPDKPAQFRTQADLVEYFSRLDVEKDLIQLELIPSKDPEPTTLTYSLSPSLFDTFAPTFPSSRPLSPPAPVDELSSHNPISDPFLDLTLAAEPTSPSAFDRVFGEKNPPESAALSFDDIFGESFAAPSNRVNPADVPLPESTSASSVNAVTPGPISPTGLATLVPDDMHSVSVYFDAEDEVTRQLSSPPPAPVSTAVSLTPSLMRTTTSDSSLPKVDAAAMHELLGMGFTSQQAAEALSKYDNNLELATNHLLDGSPDSA